MSARILRAAIALLLPFTMHAQNAARADSSALPPWAKYYLPVFDSAATSAGLVPLRNAKLAQGTREVRIWTGVAIAEPKRMYRFVEHGRSVRGDVVLYWPAPSRGQAWAPDEGRLTTDSLMRYTLRGACDRFARRAESGSCYAKFVRQPDWRGVLRSAEAHDLWTLPDPSSLPEDNVMVLDGWGITVELRDRTAYRAYQYDNPDSHPAWNGFGAQARAIAHAMSAIDSLGALASVNRVYRGVTTGRYASAFLPCGDTTAWEFHGTLEELARRSAPAVRARVDSLPLRDTASHREYYVELRGELAAPGLARYWGSHYSQVLQPFELLAIRPRGTRDCAAP